MKSTINFKRGCETQGGDRKCPTGQCCGISGSCSYPYPQGQCGLEASGRKCPKGVCYNYSGLCGNTLDYYDVDKCQSQCSGPFTQGRCGWQADNGSCPTVVCCSLSGWCGTTSCHCGCGKCQSQCKRPYPPSPPSITEGRCGKQTGGRKCPNGVCCSDLGWCGTTSIYYYPNRCQSQCSGSTGVYCSLDGWCGTTPAYCASGNCQSQCKNTLESTKNRMCGIKSFYL
uniref:Chitin-binding type-1 domain-containing protein n=1 Tax=Solanum lycopersicum TaxID=4081 RepID=A0A3Q7IUR9_SOLLC